MEPGIGWRAWDATREPWCGVPDTPGVALHRDPLPYVIAALRDIHIAERPPIPAIVGPEGQVHDGGHKDVVGAD